MKQFRTALPLLCVMLLLLCCASAEAAVGDIITVAGGVIRDGGPAIQADLLYPPDVAVDSAGKVYIVDQGHNRIRVVTPGTDIITTVVGSAVGGYDGDNGPATSAALRAPTGITFDGAGNMYIADQGNNRIRKVSPSGIITTVAGNGATGFSGDGGAATSATLNQPFGVVVNRSTGELYFSDQGNNRIRKIAADGTISTVAGTGKVGNTGDNGPATAATLYFPAGLALDGNGNLYFSDQLNNRVRKIAADGTISAFAGVGAPGYAGDGGPATSAFMGGPSGIAIRGSDIYIIDRENHVLRKVSGGIITTVSGTGNGGYAGDGGPANLAVLRHPSGVAIDGSGNIYITEQGNSSIRRITAATGIIDTFAGGGSGDYGGDGGPATAASFHMPWGVALDGADLYISDHLNNKIRKVSGTTGIITTVAGNGLGGFFGDGGPATDARMGNPRAMALDSSTGDLYIADTGNNRIRVLSTRTGIINTVAGNGTAGYSGDGGAATSAALNAPGGVALDGAGNLYIADQGNNVVRKVSVGTISTVAGNGNATFSGDGGAATSASLFSPAGVAVDGAGDLYIADMDNNRIRKVTTATGIITTVAGNGTGGYSGDNASATAAQLYFPVAIKFDGAGNMLIVDQYTMRIRKVSGGIITTIAGNGMWDYAGDNAPATASSISYPTDIAIDSSGNIFIADRINNAVREVIMNGAPVTPVAPGAPTAVSAVAASGQATISFSAPASNGGSPITGYTVTSIPAGGIDSNAGSASLSHVVTGLTNGTAYTFTVSATNAAGTGPASAPSNSVTPQAVVTAPGAPAITGAAAGNGEVTVTFTAPASNGGSAITGYTVTSNPAGGVDSSAGSTALSHVITGLTNGTAYTFTVSATNAAGIGPASAPSNSVTPLAPVSAPGAPAITGLTAGNGQVTVTFTAPASNGGSAITGYTVTSSPAGGVDSNAGSTALSHVITGLTNGTAYAFTVTAANSAGAGPPSAASASVVPVNPHDGIVTPGSGKTTPDISDVVMALRIAIKSVTPTAAQLLHADVAPLGADGKPMGDGKVDIADVIIMLRRVIGVGNW
jgi:trimeric autotransporter adhesin